MTIRHPYTTPKTPPSVGAAPPRPERAHPRVRLPGHVEFGGTRHRLHDVSLGGLCFETRGQPPRPGDTHRGTLTLTADGVQVAVGVAFRIRSTDPQGHRAGASFQDLGPAEANALRNVINSHLAGDPISVDGMPHASHLAPASSHASPGYAPPRASSTVFTRPAPPAPPPRGGSRIRALFTTALFLGAAVVAFGYTARQINRVVFASTSAAAKVAGPTYSVMMPREGTFYSLVPDDGIVKKGAPLASFEAPVLDLVRHQALGANMTPEQLQKLMKTTIKGTITSPCDCRVQAQFVANGQYVSREQPLFELMPRDFEPYLVARFRNDQLTNIVHGERVSFRVSGDPQPRIGKIVQVRAHGKGDSVDTDVMVTITPEEPLPAELLSRPAEVVAGGFPLLPDVVPGLSAVAKDRAN
jgi:mannuronan synthase